MASFKTVTMRAIAQHISDQASFMKFVVNGQTYPSKPAPKAWLGKRLTSTPYALGKLTLTDTDLTFADEQGHAFLTLPLAEVTAVQVGIYQSKIRDWGAPLQFKTQLTLNLVITTATATYDLLNQDLAALPAVWRWLIANDIAVTDPMQLQTQLTTTDWAKLDWHQVEQWAKDTPYATPYQMLGAAAPTGK